MLQLIDESRNVNMTAKFQIGQEVVLTSYQSYRKGVVAGISAQTNEKGSVFLYTIELFVGKKSAPKFKKCLEKHLYENVKDALEALAKKEEESEQSE